MTLKSRPKWSHFYKYSSFHLSETRTFRHGCLSERVKIRDLEQQRRRRLRKRHLTSEFALLSLVLICRRCICDVTTGTAWSTSRTNENMHHRDWDDQCCRPLLFSYRNGIPGSTGGHVAGASAAHENQALQCDYSNRGIWKKIIQSQRFFGNKRCSSFMQPLKTLTPLNFPDLSGYSP